MKHIFFFQYNIPAENELTGDTDKYVNVITEWNSNQFYSDGRPMVSVSPVNFTFYDCMIVKDWHKAHSDITRLAEMHFAELARKERINQAKAVLINEEALIQNHFTPVS